jgi:hypothetical protein
VVGSKGNMRRQIENTTKTQVHVPRQGKDGCIGISNVYYLILQMVDIICWKFWCQALFGVKKS